MERLKVLREQRGLSREILAADADMSPVTIWRYETGKRSPNVETLEKLAEVLDIEVSAFFPKVEPSLFEAVEQRRRRRATEARRIAEEINLPPDLDSDSIVDVMRDVEEAERRRDSQQLRRVVESGETQTNYGSVAEEFEHRLGDLLGWTVFGGFMYSGLRSAVRRILDLEEENARLRGEVEAPEKVLNE